MSAALAAPPLAPRPALELQARQPDRLRETAQEFEALFLAQMLGTLNQRLGQGLTGLGRDQGIYQDIFNQEVARLISRTAGIGVADAIFREMLKLQEVG